MTKTEFTNWLQTTTFVIDRDTGGETDTEAYDYTDDDGQEQFKPVCIAFAWNTAVATLPDGSDFDVSYQESVTWPGTFRQRFGDYDATTDHGCEDIIWSSKRPIVTEDDDADEVIDKWEIDELVKEHIAGLTDIEYVSLIPAITTVDIEIDKEDTETEPVTVERDNAPDIRFTGEKIAHASSHSPYGGSGRWTNLSIYRTKGGKFICEEIGRTQWQGEHDRFSGAVCANHKEVIAFFGHGRLAKELYCEAEIHDVVEID